MRSGSWNIVTFKLRKCGDTVAANLYLWFWCWSVLGKTSPVGIVFIAEKVRVMSRTPKKQLSIHLRKKGSFYDICLFSSLSQSSFVLEAGENGNLKHSPSAILFLSFFRLSNVWQFKNVIEVLLLFIANTQAEPTSTSWVMQQSNDVPSYLNFNYEWSQMYFLPRL